jgi:hypothetical protein
MVSGIVAARERGCGKLFQVAYQTLYRLLSVRMRVLVS